MSRAQVLYHQPHKAAQRMDVIDGRNHPDHPNGVVDLAYPGTDTIVISDCRLCPPLTEDPSILPIHGTCTAIDPAANRAPEEVPPEPDPELLALRAENQKLREENTALVQDARIQLARLANLEAALAAKAPAAEETAKGGAAKK